MKLTIFSRLVIGYLAIFIFAAVVNVYSIMQFHRLKTVTNSILMVDNRLIENEQKLTDLFLSMVRNERKFIIIKDKELYDSFLLAKNDFDELLNETMLIASTGEVKNLIESIDQRYKRYQSLFQEEVTYLKSDQDYLADNYERKKETAVNGITDDLKKIGTISQHYTYKKIIKLNKSEDTAIKAAMGMTATSLVFILIISIFITINITRPLAAIKRKTREVAGGNFESDLKLSSPPEIKDLAVAFNSMCIKLKEIDRMKLDFFSLMSHELRTPLTSIKEGTNLLIEGLSEGEIAERQKRILKIMAEESTRLIDMVNSILDISRIEAGMIKYHFTQADLIPMINKVAREIEPLAETKNVKIEQNIIKKLPVVKVDIERILQVLRNLIGNAVKFTPKGGYVRVFAVPVEKGVKVSVKDTGVGISKENLTLIFDKFHQAMLTSTGKIKGSGLGLSYVKHIIKAHGGEVWAESTLGQGSTFTFTLPV